MMEGRSNVIIVSAFGRGNWLATELANLGLSVDLVEVSEYLGRWTPEDWEGPFGYFQTEKLLASQKARLIEEDYSEDIPEGFILWLSHGPIDFRSPLSPHLLTQYGISPDSLRLVSEYESLSPEQIHLLREKIKRGTFAENWLAHLAFQLASPIYQDNASGVNAGRPLPLSAPWLIRRVSRKGCIHNLDWVISKGVKVHSGSAVLDVSVENNLISSIEIRSSWSGALLGTNFIWMLSGEETEKLSHKVAKTLFPKGVLHSTWNWIRYRVRLNKDLFLENLPVKFLMIKDLFAPWTHTNLLLVQRTVQVEDLDVWLRIPSQHRFQRSYLDEKSKEIVQSLRQRIPQCEAQVIDMPQDFLYDYDELGPPRFPIYLENDIRTLYRSKFLNITYSSSEDWQLLEWSSLLRDQLPIVDKLQKWKKDQELKAKKEVAL